MRKYARIQNFIRSFYFVILSVNGHISTNNTAQKMKFSLMDFLSKCDQIRRKLRIWSYLLKKLLMVNFIFCAVWNSVFLIHFWPMLPFWISTLRIFNESNILTFKYESDVMSSIYSQQCYRYTFFSELSYMKNMFRGVKVFFALRMNIC